MKHTGKKMVSLVVSALASGITAYGVIVALIITLSSPTAIDLKSPDCHKAARFLGKSSSIEILHCDGSREIKRGKEAAKWIFS